MITKSNVLRKSDELVNDPLFTSLCRADPCHTRTWEVFEAKANVRILIANYNYAVIPITPSIYS